MAPLNPYFGMNGDMAAEDGPYIPGVDLSGMDLASLRNFDFGSLYGGGLLGGAYIEQAPSVQPFSAQPASSAQSRFNILGQQTDNPYWGDLAALGYQSADYKAQGIRDLVKQAAQRLGYTGTTSGGAGPQDLAQLSQLLGMSEGQLAERQNSLRGSWVKDGDTTKRDSELIGALRQEYADQELYNWLNGQGFKVNTYDNGREVVQQLVGPNGEKVAVDAYNYNNDNKAVNRLGMAGALMIGGAAALGPSAGAAPTGGGVGGLGGSMSGAAPLPASVYNPAIAETIGGSISNGIGGIGAVEAAALPGTFSTAGTTFGNGATGLFDLAGTTFGAGTGTATQLAATVPGLGVGGLGSFGGAIGAGLGGAAGSALGSAAGTAPESFMGGVEYGSSGVPASSELFNPGAIGNPAPSTSGLFGNYGGSAMFDMGTAATGGGLTDTLMKWGGKAVDAFTSDPNAAKNWAGLLGGLAGASEGGKSQTATSMQQIDPRMAQYLYGSGYGDKNSLLGAAQDWWKNNQSGMNANMAQGLDTLKSLYTSPGYTQGYTQMRDVGQGLLGRSIAGNPFTQGGLLGAPMQQPMQQPMQPPRPDVGIPQFPRPAWSI